MAFRSWQSWSLSHSIKGHHLLAFSMCPGHAMSSMCKAPQSQYSMIGESHLTDTESAAVWVSDCLDQAPQIMGGTVTI